MAAVDKSVLLSNVRVLPRATVTIPGVGDVEVRGLSRAEVLKMQSVDNVDEMEDLTISFGLVEPVMNVDEVRRWRSQARSDEVRPVSDKILELSGMAPEQQHEKERNFRSEPGEG